MRQGIRQASEVIVALLLLVATASAVTNIAACQVLTTGSYYLTANILNSAAATCFDVTQQGVIFDGGGHSVQGQNGGGTQAFLIENSNVSITNVTVYNWRFGLLSNLIAIKNITIGNVTSYGNVYDIGLQSTITGPDYFYGLNLSNNTASPSTYTISISGPITLDIENSSVGLGSSANMKLDGNGLSVSMLGVKTDYGRIVPTAAENIDVNISDIANTNAILLKAMDETTGGRLWFNWSIANGPLNQSYYNQYIYLNNYTNFTGAPQIYMNSTGYLQKLWTQTISTNYYRMTPMIVNTSTQTSVNIIVWSPSYTPIANAVVNMYPPALGYSIIGDTKTTDTSGVVQFTGLSTTTLYEVTVTAPGYALFQAFMTPVSSTIQYVLGFNQTSAFNFPFNDTFCDIQPANPTLTNNSVNTFTAQIATLRNTSGFSSCGWNLFLMNSSGQYVFWNSSIPTMNITNSSTCIFQQAIDPNVNITHQILVQPFFYDTDFNSTFYCSRTYTVYYIGNYTNMTLPNFFSALASPTGGLSQQAAAFILAFLAMIACAAIGMYSQLAGGFAFIICLGVLSLYGLIGWSIFVLFALATLALFVWRYMQ